jgi:hypothetical protein
MARRHIRLCGKIKDASQYSEQMQPKLEALRQKESDRKAAEEQCKDVLDDITLKETSIDNMIRDLYELVNIHGRHSITQFMPVLFPNSTFSEIIMLPLSDKLLKTTQVIEKLKSLGETTEVSSYIGNFTQASDEIHEAISEHRVADDNYSRRQAEEELARNAVRTQYENNYFDARKNLSKHRAEMPFPQITNKPKKHTSVEIKNALNE